LLLARHQESVLHVLQTVLPALLMPMMRLLVLNAHLHSIFIKKIVNQPVLKDITKTARLDGVLNADVIAKHAQATMSAHLALVFLL